MKKISLVIIVCGVMSGCGQERGSSGPALSSDQIKINKIKEELNINNELKKQQARSLYEQICTYSDSNLNDIKEISSKIDNNLATEFYGKNNGLNDGAIAKLQVITNEQVSVIEEKLLSYYEEYKSKLTSSELYTELLPNELMYLSYLTVASEDEPSFVSTLYSIKQLYQSKFQSVPNFYYLARLTYFINESESRYELSADVLSSEFIEMFPNPESYTGTSVYSHVLQFLNKNQTSQNFSSLSNNKFTKLSIAMNTSEAELQNCVEQYTRNTFQSILPFGFYNNEKRVIRALEVMALKNKKHDLSYLIILL